MTVLRSAANLFDGQPGNPKVLIVVSDGEPSGPGDGSGELHRAVAAVQAQGDVLLVGVGLGPNTDHVATYYPEAIANVPLEAFPEALGQCLSKHLLG